MPSPRISEDLLDLPPARTNLCWLVPPEGVEGVLVCGYRFMLHLDGPAVEIWQRLDGRRTIRQISSELALNYGTDEEDKILRDTTEFVKNLERLGLAAWSTRPLFEGVELHA